LENNRDLTIASTFGIKLLANPSSNCFLDCVRSCDERLNAPEFGLADLDLYLIKSRGWSYEREWRLVDCVDGPHDEDQCTGHVPVGLDPGMVQLVTLGRQADDDLKSKRCICDEAGVRARVGLVRVATNKRDYALYLTECPRVERPSTKEIDAVHSPVRSTSTRRAPGSRDPQRNQAPLRFSRRYVSDPFRRHFPIGSREFHPRWRCPVWHE
jgi:hypothetical protein